MDMFAPTTEEVVKPHDQLTLDDKEMEEEITKILTAKNPTKPKAIFRFNLKEKVFKPEALVDQLEVHFSQDGWLMHEASDEAKAQIEADKAEEEKRLEAENMEEGTEEAEEAGLKVLRNQFNFSERAIQTSNQPIRIHNTMTMPAERKILNVLLTQHEIYDAYLENEARKAAFERTMAREKAIKAGKLDPNSADAEEEAPKHEEKAENPMTGTSMAHFSKVLERMTKQNAYDEITMDFKYWEDASDEFRDSEGTVLPLWRFRSRLTKRKAVTGIAWNPQYTDMFAVTYGSYEFTKQGSGVINIFSLKNPANPEYYYVIEHSGVMCIDWHPTQSNLLCVGLYDGGVHVYDIKNREKKPIYESTIKVGKHSEPVWQVKWQEDDTSKNLTFYSISSDGRVTTWVLTKNELQWEDLMELKLENNVDDIDGDEGVTGLAGGCSMGFNSVSEHLFIVGTEEGKVHKCSKAYASQYLQTYAGHQMAVYTVTWNNKHPDSFLSCSADWTVKLWEHTRQNPISTFDLNAAVGDVAWAPFSSTVFAACTQDGKVHIFDLHQRKFEPICEQKIVKKAKLTKISFSPTHPIILVGDDDGGVSSLKLSPNLRKDYNSDSTDAVQKERLDHLIALALKGESTVSGK